MCRVEEESQQVFGNDIKLLSVGYILTFIYFATFLGKFNRKEHKVCTVYLKAFLIVLFCYISFGLQYWEFYASVLL